MEGYFSFPKHFKINLLEIKRTKGISIIIRYFIVKLSGDLKISIIIIESNMSNRVCIDNAIFIFYIL